MVATRRAKAADADNGETVDETQIEFAEPELKKVTKTPSKTPARKAAPATDKKSVMKGARTPRTRSRADAPPTPVTPADASLGETQEGSETTATPAKSQPSEKIEHSKISRAAKPSAQKASGKKKRFDDDNDDDLDMGETGYMAVLEAQPPKDSIIIQPQVCVGVM